MNDSLNAFLANCACLRVNDFHFCGDSSYKEVFYVIFETEVTEA